MGKKSVAILTVLTLIGCLFFIDIPVQAAEQGVWVLVNQYFEIEEPDNSYGCAYYIKNYKYDESEKKAYFEKEAHLSNIDGDFHCMFYASGQVLTPVVKADEPVKFAVESHVSGNTLDNMGFSNNLVTTIKGYLLWFRDVNEYSHYYITSCTGVDYTQSDSAIVEYKLGNGKNYGDQEIIDMCQSSGNSTSGLIHSYFVYEWRASAPSITAPGKVTIKKASVGTNKVTVKIKKITKNCKGYEFEIATKKDFSDAKVYTVNKNKTVKKAISGLKEDVIYYVRVRAFNSKDGQKAYGPYSKVKKVVL